MSGDILVKNATIDVGPPVRYAMRRKENILDVNKDEPKLMQYTVGEKDPSKPNKTILLVGESGSGKTALINSFLNYAMGTRREDKVWYEIVTEAEQGSRSVTSKVKVYEILFFEDKTQPFSLTIIDTPGYGDTGGVERDALIAQKLLDLFGSEDGINSIDAVGLVMKATDNRLSDRLMYIFNSVLSLFGKDLEKHLIALITHSDGMPPTVALKALDDANIKIATNEENQPIYFTFNNCLNTKITEDTEFGLEQAWKVTMRGMSKITAFLEQNPPQMLEKTVQVLNEQIRLAACVNNMADKINLNKEKQHKIKQIQEALEENQEKLRSGENFEIKVDEPYQDKEEIDGGMWLMMFGGAVTCSVCKENCHYPGCTWAWYPKHCKVMKNGHCTVCTNKCPAKKHVKEKWKYVTKTRKAKKTIEDLKKIYEDKTNEGATILSKLQKEKESLETEIKSLLDEAYSHVLNLEKNALSVTSMFSFIDLDTLYEEVKERKDTEKIQKVEEIRGQVDKGIWAGLWYKCGKIGGKLAVGFPKFRT